MFVLRCCPVFEVSTCLFLQDDDEISVKSDHSAKSATSSSSESTTVKSHRSAASSTASSSTARSQPPPTQVRKIVKVFYSPDMVNYQFQNSIFFYLFTDSISTCAKLHALMYNM